MQKPTNKYEAALVTAEENAESFRFLVENEHDYYARDILRPHLLSAVRQVDALRIVCNAKART